MSLPLVAPIGFDRTQSLTALDIHHQVAEGDTVMNARTEIWERRNLRVVLPVAGVFVTVTTVPWLYVPPAGLRVTAPLPVPAVAVVSA